MEVRCNRCGTEYEFDDVLISERGTTVKCTNCGFQFKVFAAGLTSSVPERWVVRTLGGEEISFTSLRELQRGIAERRVGPQDLLSRGNEQPRRLGLIAELEPFFVVQSSVPIGPIQRTLHGVAPERPSDPHLPPSAPATIVEHRSFDSLRGNAAPTLRTTPVPEAAPRSSVVSTRGRESSEPSQALRSQPVQLSVERTNASPAQRAALERLSSTLPSAPAPAPQVAPASGSPAVDLGPGEVEAGSVRSRWIAALVIGGVAVLLALTVGRRYLTNAAQPQARAPATVVDPRVTEMLAEGNRLTGDGDWDAARERLLKASALAERDGRVLSALARLEGLRADAAWLELRLTDPAATERVQARKRELERRVARAEQTADAALSQTPRDIVAIRARVDAFRMKGELARARERLGPIATAASDPANAYVLAAIDLAEDPAASSSAIDRLRTAAAAESPAGRARVALVYALARAGRATEAESELGKLGTNSPLLGLVPELKAFVARTPASAGSVRAPSPKPSTSAPAAERNTVGASEPRRLLDQARRAVQNGQLDAAEELYYQVLESRPSTSEALAGLGDIARKRNDPRAAEEMYERALNDNPSYLPALLASADQKWQAGDRKGAVTLYQRVVSQAAQGSDLRRRAAARLAEAAATPAEEVTAKPEPPPAKPPASATATRSPVAPPNPHIDTTDLPESK